MKKCFVCEVSVEEGTFSLNKELNLPVCDTCKDSDAEKKAVDDYREGLAEGFVCGCI